MSDDHEKEKRAMAMMRQVLSAVARDTVPPPGMNHPLTESTIQGIRDCLAYITAREKELGEMLGEESQHRPRFVDEPKAPVVHIDSIKKDS